MSKNVAIFFQLIYNQNIKKIRGGITMAEVKKQEKPKETKKTNEQTKGKGEEKKIQSGIIIALIAVIAVVAIIIGIMSKANSPKKIVEEEFSKLKEGGDTQEMLGNSLESWSFAQDAQKLFFNKLEYKVKNEQKDGDSSTVEVEITNKDFKTIMSNYMQKALKIAMAGQGINEEELKNYLIEELSNEEIQTITQTKTIKLNKQDGKWKMSEENDFTDILLPGFTEAMNALN